MATFRKRGKTVQAQVRVRGQRPVSATFPTLKQAEVWAVNEEARLKAGDTRQSLIETQRQANRALLRDALRDYASASAPLSMHGRYSLKHGLAEPVAGISLGRLTKQDAFETKRRYLERFVPDTAARHLKFIRRAIDYYMDDPQFPNVFNNLLSASSKTRWTRFVEEEERRFMENTQDTLLKDFVVFALETAMRRGEILGIRQNHLVDGQRLFIPKTKTNKPRTIPLTKKALAILERRLSLGEVPFAVHKDTIYKRFIRVCKRAGLEPKRVHDLRREALSRWSARGLSTHQLMQISGHQAVGCLSIYVRGNLNELESRIRELT